MATTLLCGFEMGALSEAANITTSSLTPLSISTSIFRTGASSLRLSGSFSIPNSCLDFQSRPAGGTLKAFARSFRFYLRAVTLPTVQVTIVQVGSVAAGTIVNLNTDGSMAVTDGTGSGGATSSLTIPVDGNFHRIDVDVVTTTRTLYMDGVLAASGTGLTSAVAQTNFQIGGIATAGGVSSTLDVYFDDLLVDDASIGAPASDANNKIALLIPTAGNNAGSWTDGAGGTGDIHGSVDNIPPVGVAAATAAAKIKNAASGTALDYVATMQTYTVGGIPAGSTVNAIMAICNDGEEVATGTKSGGIWCASNPAQSAVTVGTGVGFDYGDDVGALGTFPTGWSTHVGIVAVAPSVTLGTAPTVTVRKGSSTTRVVDVDFMGLYVDYSPPPIAQTIVSLQSVKRASYW